MIDTNGNAVAVPADAVAEAITRGFKVEAAGASTDRLAAEANQDFYGDSGGQVAAVGAGFLRGLSFGGSDIALGAIGGEEGRAELAGYREANPGLSTAGNIAGALAPALLTTGGSLAARGALAAGERDAGSLIGGAISRDLFGGASAGERFLASTPAGLASRLGSKIAATGEGAGIVGRTAAVAGAGAAEGALQNAGAYISDVALGDRELSADGFVGAMGQGALWGGAAGGALSIGSNAVTAARKLFPKQEMTRAAVQKAREEAVTAVRETVDDGKQLITTAEDTLKTRRAMLARDPAVRAELDAIAVRKATELADADIAIARSRQAEAGSKAEAAAARAERAKNPPKRTRKAMGGEDAPAAPEPVPARAPKGVDSELGVAPSVGANTATDAATALERQLAGTKSALDAGESLAALSAKRTAKASVEDALNEHIAKIDPESARLMTGIKEAKESQTALDGWLAKYGKGGAVGKAERSAAARETADSWRSKKPGYYSKVPEGEGTPGLARGREWEYRGSMDERAAAEEAFYAKQGGRAALESSTRRVFPDELTAVADDAQAAIAAGDDMFSQALKPSLDEQLKKALGDRVKDIGDDLDDAAAAVGRTEAAHADLTDALGPAAPARAQEKAAALRDAQRKSEQGASEAAARHAGDAEQAAATIGLDGAPAGAAGKGGLINKALGVGDIIEALNLMGIPVPDTSKIPVIGPVLKAVLQARVLAKSFGRFGGKVAETAETVIAGKAAAQKQRLYSAVDSMLDASSKGMAKAARVAPAPAAILGHKLFDDGTEREAKKGDTQALYMNRLDELTAAVQPGAIVDAVRKRVRAADPALVDSIAATEERKLQYLFDKAPKPDAPNGLLEKKWSGPSPMEIRGFARIVNATEDPAGVIERVAAGAMVMPDEIDAIKHVYPRLYDEARMRVVTMAADKPTTNLPRARRVQLSLLFDLPLDGTMRPEYVQMLQQGNKASAQQQMAPQQPQQPPTPTIAAPMNVGSAYDPYRSM
jgi:hypothetical protein